MYENTMRLIDYYIKNGIFESAEQHLLVLKSKLS